MRYKRGRASIADENWRHSLLSLPYQVEPGCQTTQSTVNSQQSSVISQQSTAISQQSTMRTV
ncbi:hypothetical protein QUB56_17860 [Microcoleus sp. AR_TQ3_B6]|uniref:hypothetical protein n=1 Tax=Microcoleus sp. AR_TQ3_B6 TaxID=3055284 RepID=UPI002FD66214